MAYRNGPAQQATALQWLQGHGSQQQIKAALSSVLTRLWSQAFAAGVQAALVFTQGIGAVQLALDALTLLRSEWLDEITATRMRALADALAEGGTVGKLTSAVLAVLGDKAAALRIAVTEITRAENDGRYRVYQNALVPQVRWITTSGDPCPVCIANEMAGPRPLGSAFPSGLTAPPEHPHCECELVPA